MVDVLAGEAPSYATVKYWVREFREGRETTEDQHRTGRPASSVTQENITAVQDLVMSDRRFTIRHIASTLGFSFSTVQRILVENLDLHKVSARWVPKQLTQDQRRMRVTISKELLARYQEDPEKFISQVVTVDETWVHHFDPTSKEESKEWRHRDSPPPRKFRVTTSRNKIMATIFWDAKGILLVDYLPHGHTVTGIYYADLLRQLKVAVKEKRRGKLSHGVLLLQDNAPPHMSQVAMAACEACSFQTLPHPAYSPDLAPSDFHLFRFLKNHIRGTHFDTDDDVMDAVDSWLNQQEESFFRTGIEALESRWMKCISLKGDYIEKQ